MLCYLYNGRKGETQMKRIFKTFLSFLITALAVEVGILIMTKVAKWDNFELGRPFLAAVHVHLMAMGALFFLIQIVLEKVFSLSSAKLYNAFYVVFLAGLSVVVGAMMYKGIAQIFGFEIIRGITEGCAALGHTATFVALFLFAACLWEKISPQKDKQDKK